MFSFRKILVLNFTFWFSLAAYSEAGDPPAPELVNIQNIEFEVSHSNGGWISMGSDQSPEYLRSISIKYKFKDGQAPATVSEDSLRNAVKQAAEERCRLLGASDRPPEVSSSATLHLSAEISSQQVAIRGQEFNGKYICAVNLKP